VLVATIRQLVEKGIRSGDFPAQHASVSAAAVVGVIAEALVGPLAWSDEAQPGIEEAELIGAIQAFCLRAVATKTQ